jgi:uncharacterized repeat protein (TIGR01451 family)
MKHGSDFVLVLRVGLALTVVGALLAAQGAGRVPVTKAASTILAIPPTMQWNTFMGGSSFDYSSSIALDGSGNVYAIGYSYATWGSPVRAYTGGADAFVAKLNGSGARQWNTFLGSSSDDQGNGVAVDGSGNVYVVGTSNATWGSPLNPFQGGPQDAFVAKLNSSGVLQWNTFLGGSAADLANGIAVDGTGNVYVVGISTATWGSPIDPYPVGKWQSPFAAKLNSSGTLQWNTFWGASSLDTGNSIAVDGSGNVFVVGGCYETWGSPVNAFAGSSDACVVKLDTTGHQQWNTFMGSSDSDSGNGIAVGNGNVYVVGISSATWGTPVNPFSGGSGYDAFAASLNAGNGVRQWNTFMGGPDPDEGNGITTDGAGNVYVVGDTHDTWNSSNVPASVFTDAFLVKLKSDGSRDWIVFMGATYNNDTGTGVAADGNGHVYVVGQSNDTWGSPIVPYTASLDTFVAKWEVPAQTDLAITKSAKPGVTNPGKTITYTLTFSNMGYLTATGVLITDVVPITLTNVSYTRSGVAITPTGSVSYTWKVQDLPPGGGGVITITGMVSPGLQPGTVFINTATLTSTTADSDPDNNSSSARVLVPSTYLFLPLVLKN